MKRSPGGETLDDEPVSGTVSSPLESDVQGTSEARSPEPASRLAGANPHAIEALVRSEANFRSVIEQAPDGIVVEREGRIVYANQACAKLLGHATDSLLGGAVLALIHPDDRGVIAERMAAVNDGQSASPQRVRIVRRDQSVCDVESTAMPIVYDGAPAALIIVRDLAATLRIERQMLASERMASVGSLAAGLAHEINNPLSAVVTNLEFVRDVLARLAPSEPNAAIFREISSAIEDAERGAERVSQIVQSLRTFSRVEDDRRAPVDVQRALELALGMASNEIRHRAQLLRAYRPVPRVDANEARLGQVFLNLVLNAAQAIPEGNASDNEITIATRVDEEARVVVEITDTGCGMPREILERIFEPFFTTKPVGVGTGLGLSVARNIVRSLGGEIDVESRAGQGTTFRITLPRSRPALRPASTKPEPAPSKRRGRVLVIDDEPMIGTSIRRMLSDAHDVEITTRAIEALEKIRTGARYDAILCDLMMPELTGMDVYEALAAEFPDQAARIVFLTGGIFTERARTFVEERPHRVLSKPFKPQLLKDVVAALLVG